MVKLLVKTTFPIQTTVRHGSWFLCRNCVSQVFVVVVWCHWVAAGGSTVPKIDIPHCVLTVVVVVDPLVELKVGSQALPIPAELSERMVWVLTCWELLLHIYIECISLVLGIAWMYTLANKCRSS